MRSSAAVCGAFLREKTHYSSQKRNHENIIRPKNAITSTLFVPKTQIEHCRISANYTFLPTHAVLRRRLRGLSLGEPLSHLASQVLKRREDSELSTSESPSDIRDVVAATPVAATCQNFCSARRTLPSPRPARRTRRQEARMGGEKVILMRLFFTPINTLDVFRRELQISAPIMSDTRPFQNGSKDEQRIRSGFPQLFS